MPTVDVVDLNNQKVGELELSDAVFGAEVNEALLYEAVRHYQAGRRGGNAKTKTRARSAGSGKKLWKQKGTGRARMGSIRSPLWRHGGTVHGPQPRDYSYQPAAEDAARRAALGALGQAARRRIEGGAGSSPDRSQDQDACARRSTRSKPTKTVLLVDNSATNRNLDARRRAISTGVTLVASRDVTAYHLLGHKSVFLSAKPRREKLSEALA